MPKTKDVYPVNEGVSGYWDALSPEDLAVYDYALDFAQVYISASKGNEGISKPISDQFAREALVCLSACIPRTLGQRSGSVYPPVTEERERGITLVS